MVDAFDGPMPQTRFVTKISVCSRSEADRGHPTKLTVGRARPDWVVDQVFDLPVNLDATDEQLTPDRLRFRAERYRGVHHEDMAEDSDPLYQAIVDRVLAPDVDSVTASLQMVNFPKCSTTITTLA